MILIDLNNYVTEDLPYIQHSHCATGIYAEVVLQGCWSAVMILSVRCSLVIAFALPLLPSVSSSLATPLLAAGLDHHAGPPSPWFRELIGIEGPGSHCFY